MKNKLSNSILSLALGGAVALGVLTNVACDDDDDETIDIDTGAGGSNGGFAGSGGGFAGSGGGFAGAGGGFAGGGGATAGKGGGGGNY